MIDASTPQSGGRPPRRPWLVVVAIAAVVVGIAALFHLQRPAPSPSPEGLTSEISVAQAAAMRDRGTFLLDVREPDEWAEAHVPGSTLIPLGDLETRIAEVPRDREVVVLCRSGNRSKRGRDILLAAGYDRVASVSGGLTAWQAEGHPTVSGP